MKTMHLLHFLFKWFSIYLFINSDMVTQFMFVI